MGVYVKITYTCDNCFEVRGRQLDVDEEYDQGLGLPDGWKYVTGDNGMLDDSLLCGECVKSFGESKSRRENAS